MFNLNRSVDLNNINAANLNRLQGNTLLGHGRDFSTQIFLQFGADKNAVMKWIENFAATLTSVSQQQDQIATFKADNEPENTTSTSIFRAFMLSAQGYRQLGFSEDFLPEDSSFRLGMNHPSIQAKLGDNPTDREEAFTHEIHAMVLVACDDPDVLRTKVNAIVASAMPFMALHVQEGDAIFNAQRKPIEHFGYVDGISQPLFTRHDINKVKRSVGMIDDQAWENRRTDPSADLSLVLVKDRNAPVIQESEGFGTYVVYRKLEQNVTNFNNAVRALAARQQAAARLAAPNPDLAGAQVVGRFKDGTPLITAALPRGGNPDNTFDYTTDGPGNICPYQAHIRKTNPRGDIMDSLGGLVSSLASVAGLLNSDLNPSLENERSRRIARRGITYQPQQNWKMVDLEGNVRNWTWTANAAFIWERPEENQGLLFMCHQANLAHQFEFMQQTWANNNDFAPSQNTPGQDGVIGQGTNPATRQLWPVTRGSANKVDFDFSHFVTFRGGEYFFAPDIEFLRNISNNSIVPKQREGLLNTPITLFNAARRLVTSTQTPTSSAATQLGIR